jgi:hypothetical protein
MIKLSYCRDTGNCPDPARKGDKVWNCQLLKFAEYLQLYEDSSFIEYINERTRQAVQEKKSGKYFTSLEELQREYA